MKARQSNNQRIWVKSKDSGNVYICPVGALTEPREASEDELQARCLDDARRPDNY